VNWDAIGAIAEGLGAIGVIATVIYVALQIRQNSKAIEGATEQALMDQEINVYSVIADHANVFRRGCANTDDLDEDEDIEFEYLVTATMSQLYSAFVQYQRNLIPESVWTAYCTDWSTYHDMHGFMQVWARISASYPIEFREALENLVQG
jgi:hypothetical protein